MLDICISISKICVNDGIGEAPHAIASNIFKSSRGCTFVWASASMRTNQNLRDCNKAIEEGMDLQHAWGTWTKVLSPPGAVRRLRLNRTDVGRRFYHMDQFGEGFDTVAQQPPVEVIPDGDSGDDSHESGGGGEGPGAENEKQIRAKAMAKVAKQRAEVKKEPIRVLGGEGETISHIVHRKQ